MTQKLNFKCIERDRNGFATDECLDKILSSLPVILAHVDGRDIDYEIITKHHDLYQWRGEIDSCVNFTEYCPLFVNHNNTNELTLNEYQQKAMSTCMDSCENFSYMMLNIVSEVGEFAGKVAKRIRKEEAEIEHNVLCMQENELVEKELMLEAGDILWQLSGLCLTMGWKLEDVAQANLEKLAARKAAGTIDGNGDGIYNR